MSKIEFERIFEYLKSRNPVVVAQLVEQALLTPEIHGLNRVVGKFSVLKRQK